MKSRPENVGRHAGSIVLDQDVGLELAFLACLTEQDADLGGVGADRVVWFE